jgi:DUF4097 and DUF4098 domain-containing protein YvlB
MKKATTLSVALLAALGLTACGDSTGPDMNVEQYHGLEIEGEWSGQLAFGEEIEIKGISGNIDASFTSGQDVVVSWTKQGQQNDPEEVTVDVVRHAGGVTICAVYPDVPGGIRNECGPGLTGHMATRENDVAVDFVVSVPAGVDFNGRTIAGDVSARDLQSDVFGSTINGDVDITTTELAEGSAVSGSVTARFGRTGWDGELAFSALSGNVTVSVPTNANAEVWATAVNGTVNSDFSLQRLADGSLRGSIGAGGGLLRLSTVTGNVRLRRGS